MSSHTRRRRPLHSLTRHDTMLLIKALAYCGTFRVALWVLPSVNVLRYVRTRVDRAVASPHPRADAKRIGWAVRTAGRRVPFSTCLVEALAAQLLLARNGLPSELRVGVGRDANQKFIAHAWVEVNGRILVGTRRGQSYRVLPDLGPVLKAHRNPDRVA